MSEVCDRVVAPHTHHQIPLHYDTVTLAGLWSVL